MFYRGVMGGHFLALGCGGKYYKNGEGEKASSGFEGVQVQVAFLEKKY